MATVEDDEVTARIEHDGLIIELEKNGDISISKNNRLLVSLDKFYLRNEDGGTPTEEQVPALLVYAEDQDEVAIHLRIKKDTVTVFDTNDEILKHQEC